MRRTVSSVVLGVILLLVMPATPSAAWGYYRGHYWHGWGGPRVVVGVGPAFGWGFYAPAPYYVIAPPPVVVQQQQQVYVQQPSAPSDGYWYYCQSAGAYYPRAATCSEPWVKVPPTPQ